MAMTALCPQTRVYNFCLESPQHGLSEIAGHASLIQHGGWSRFSNAACLGVLRTSHVRRPQCYHCVNARQDVTSSDRFHDVNILSPASWSLERRVFTRTFRQCNALPIGAVEGDEEEGTPWEGAVMFRRSAAQSRADYATTLERLGLTRFSSEKAISLAIDMGLETSEVDGVVGTPVQITVEVTKEGRDYRVDGVLRTALTMVCNRCLAPVAERIYTSFNLLLTEDPVKEPTQVNLGVVLGEDAFKWSAEDDDDVEAELDIDLDDKLHFPRDQKECDLSKYLRDTIHLEIPAKSLCDSACPGLCFGCGVNLNNTPCRCGKKKKTENTVNMEEILGLNRKKDIWGPLEQLKKQLEEQQQDRSDDPKL
ncbi:hypothetical protein M758_4G012800 [Ceratodon purpureus]|nr:hypothetical protein M758_4G012800 [Ceratodon purpureus]